MPPHPHLPKFFKKKHSRTPTTLSSLRDRFRAMGSESTPHLRQETPPVSEKGHGRRPTTITYNPTPKSSPTPKADHTVISAEPSSSTVEKITIPFEIEHALSKQASHIVTPNLTLEVGIDIELKELKKRLLEVYQATKEFKNFRLTEGREVVGLFVRWPRTESVYGGFLSFFFYI